MSKEQIVLDSSRIIDLPTKTIITYIEFNGPDRRCWNCNGIRQIQVKQIRFAYWRRPEGKKGSNDWNWASQTTWVFDKDTTREAIREAERLGFFD